jgi:hypothetical protein
LFEREASSVAAERWHLVCATPLFSAGVEGSTERFDSVLA